MTTRTPIQPAEIRHGDLVRCERGEDVREGRVSRYADDEIRFEFGRDWYVPGSTIYLLDRPDAFPVGSTWYVAEDCRSWYTTAKRGEEVIIKALVDNVPGDERTVEVVGDQSRQGIILKTKYLVKDRPKPAVILPTVPTLGWATHANDGQFFGLFSQNPSTPQIVDCVTCRWGRFSWEPTYITAFTEAVAVPKAALDELRVAVEETYKLQFDMPVRAAWDFLAAVDNASTR